MKIYTKTGDAGETGLFSGPRVSKGSDHVTAYGDVDELNSIIGLAIAALKSDDVIADLTKIQHDLHCVGADLATPLEAKTTIDRISEDRTVALERMIDRYEGELPRLIQFILPGGDQSAALLHVARTVCRRAERSVVRLRETVAYNGEVLKYLNRLSDLLFVLARVANKRLGRQDVFWEKNLK